jgi:hypothetical protein
MDTRHIRIRCPRLVCTRLLWVPEDARGRVIRCGNCGTLIRVPRSVATSSKTAPEGAATKD